MQRAAAEDRSGCSKFPRRQPGQDAKHTVVTDGTATLNRPLLLLSENRRGGLIGNGSLQVLAAEGEGLRAVAVGEE